MVTFCLTVMNRANVVYFSQQHKQAFTSMSMLSDAYQTQSYTSNIENIATELFQNKSHWPSTWFVIMNVTVSNFLNVV